jgi:arylsulfatase A-like enzyme
MTMVLRARVLFVALSAAGLLGFAIPALAPAAAAPSLPNILLVITDDQPKGTMDAMPTLQDSVARRGMTFTNGIIPTSLCCPSRASLLTGNHSHTTGVYTIERKYGGWKTFHANAESDTIATRLDTAGYNTGLFGKYLNGYSRDGWSQGIVPPGWDTFRAMLPDDGGDGTYYEYRITGLDPYYGSGDADYSTDVFGQLAVDHIKSTPADVPWFVYYAPYAPHAPFTPARRHDGTWPMEPAQAIGALNERDVSDKPRWIRNNPLVDARQERRKLTDQHETLKAVDENLAAMLRASDMSNTLVIFLSDNGLMLGSHRVIGKNVPHARSSEVPMYVRWDGMVPTGARNSRITPQIDLTALMADAAGVTWPMDGHNPMTTGRHGTVVEQTSNRFSLDAPLDDRHPAYCGWRTKRYLYVEYDAGKGREFYDYKRDPHELRNAIRKDRYADRVSAHRQAAQTACSPVPPGFDW